MNEEEIWKALQKLLRAERKFGHDEERRLKINRLKRDLEGENWTRPKGTLDLIQKEGISANDAEKVIRYANAKGLSVEQVVAASKSGKLRIDGVLWKSE